MAKQARRRRRPQQPVQVQEPVRSGFTLGNLVNLGAIPLLTALITGIGFYFSTNAKLERYADEIVSIKRLVGEKTTEDNVQREKIRDAFLAAQTKTNDGIGKLDTRLAVAEKQQETANIALGKISETLQRISSFPSSTGRVR